MNHQTILLNSEQNCSEMFSEPVHFPLVFGNETYVLTIQDQRNVIDRRSWFLSRSSKALSTNAVPLGGDNGPINLNPLIAQILMELQANGAAYQMDTLPAQHIQRGQAKPFCFHYEKQTDTEDLSYYQNYDRLKQGEMVIKHVHYYVESAMKSRATNTETTMETEEITDIEDITL
ncbi:uncharacterized protein LOC128709852 [Anopheles marshallii]|uniref:uncharacterized protein LOC128709852 n=1 Tax=Anopheles marshallii TaxID=1521116 RepID=UPI00237BF76F|nr:uncharacterized protein LOC128709852 [Anopheles marshallii]